MLLFIIIVIASYVLIPHICDYWKKYLLHAQATDLTIKCLYFVSAMERISITITRVLKGRGEIIYTLSIVAWLIEIGGALILAKIYEGIYDVSMMLDYLSAALGRGNSMYLQHFVLVTIVMMICTYIIYVLLKRLKEYKYECFSDI